MKITEEKISELTEKGFKRWTKGGMDRLYVNSGVLGLTYTTYKTGNISSACLCGEEISNSRGRQLRDAKTYVDLVKGLIVSDDARLAHLAAELGGITLEDNKDCDKILKIA